MPSHSSLTDSFILLIQQHERIILKVCSVYANGHPEDHKDLFQSFCELALSLKD